MLIPLGDKLHDRFMSMLIPLGDKLHDRFVQRFL